jgi:hypothetical protein
MDVLYRVRPTRRNEPLRYSLRSLSNVLHGDVFVVGGTPHWVKGVHVIPGDRYTSKWKAMAGELHKACMELSGRTLLLVDDDMFVRRPFVTWPTLHAGSLATHALTARGAYQRSMFNTAVYLERLGIPTPVSYELHIPMVIDADAMAATLEAVLQWREPLQPRSVYGNLQHVGGDQHEDVKVRALGKDDALPPGPFLSASPRAWFNMAPKIMAEFPTPSEFEA